MTKFNNVSCYSIFKYFGSNHYSFFFKNRRGLGGIFLFILMETFSSLALLRLQHVCSHFKLFLSLTFHLFSPF